MTNEENTVWCEETVAIVRAYSAALAATLSYPLCESPREILREHVRADQELALKKLAAQRGDVRVQRALMACGITW